MAFPCYEGRPVSAGGRPLAVPAPSRSRRPRARRRSSSGSRPLTILTALYHGKDDIATAILKREPGLTVFEAAAAGDAARVREIVGRDKTQPNAVAPDGYSPLGLSALFKRRDVVRYLLEAGADPRPASRQGGFTPLHSAVATETASSDSEIVRMLLDKGAHPNARIQSGSTPLHTVAFIGAGACLDLLLKHGADRGKNNDGKTAAAIAVERGHKDLGKVLAPRSIKR